MSEHGFGVLKRTGFWMVLVDVGLIGALVGVSPWWVAVAVAPAVVLTVFFALASELMRGQIEGMRYARPEAFR